jgi:hypothetical protein
VFHVVDTNIDDSSHNDDKDEKDFIFWNYELTGSFLNNFSNLDWIERFKKSLIFMFRFLWSSAIDLSQLFVVVDSPNQAYDAWYKDKSDDKRH